MAVIVPQKKMKDEESYSCGSHEKCNRGRAQQIETIFFNSWILKIGVSSQNSPEVLFLIEFFFKKNLKTKTADIYLIILS